MTEVIMTNTIMTDANMTDTIKVKDDIPNLIKKFYLLFKKYELVDELYDEFCVDNIINMYKNWMQEYENVGRVKFSEYYEIAKNDKHISEKINISQNNLMLIDKIIENKQNENNENELNIFNDMLIEYGKTELQIIGIIRIFFELVNVISKTNTVDIFDENIPNDEFTDIMDMVHLNATKILENLNNIRNGSKCCSKFIKCKYIMNKKNNEDEKKDKDDEDDLKISDIVNVCGNCSNFKTEHTPCIFFNKSDAEYYGTHYCTNCNFLEYEHNACDLFIYNNENCVNNTENDNCNKCGMTRCQHIRTQHDNNKYHCNNFDHNGYKGCKNCIHLASTHMFIPEYYMMTNKEMVDHLNNTINIDAKKHELNTLVCEMKNINDKTYTTNINQKINLANKITNNIKKTEELYILHNKYISKDSNEIKKIIDANL